MQNIFKTWCMTKNNYARQWKKLNPSGLVLGYLCTYTPEEIMYAANILPVRIFNSRTRQTGETSGSGIFRPFCLDSLGQVGLGEYDCLDGLVITQGCPHSRGTLNSWASMLDISFCYHLPIPNNMQSQ